MTEGLLPKDTPWAVPEGPCYVLDIETDGFADVYTRVHSLVIREGRSGALLWSLGGPSGVCPSEAADKLSGAASLVAHNGFGFDFDALRDLLGWQPRPNQVLLDTLAIARVVFPDLKDTDGALLQTGKLPGKLFGRQSIEAWGYRLGHAKVGTEIEDWSTWTPLMQARCESDTAVNQLLLQKLLSRPTAARAVELELAATQVCGSMVRTGFPFDLELAQSVLAELVTLRAKIESQVRAELRGWWRPEVTEPKYPTKPRRQFLEHELGLPVNRGTKRAPDWRTGYFLEWDPERPWTPMEWVEFNPTSRDQVAEFLKRRYGWDPVELTDSGKPQVDEAVLAKLPWPEAKLLSRLFLVSKRLGQLAEGKEAWIGHRRADGRIHGSIDPSGTITSRAAHFAPNLGQVPAVKVREDKDAAGGVTKVLLAGEKGEWGLESRSMFTAPRGRVLVGADLSKLELLCLAHYTAPFDKGEYREIVLSGDPHVYMQKAAAVDTRAKGKTTNYAFLYGAGDRKLGSIADPTAAASKQAQLGKALRARVLKNFAALGSLTRAIGPRVSLGYLFGLDGRRIHIRSPHSALNTLLQSAGALISKRWLVELRDLFREKGLELGEGWQLHAWIHDECQFSVLPEHVALAEEVAIQAAANAGRYLKLHVPILAEAKHGPNWAATH